MTIALPIPEDLRLELEAWENRRLSAEEFEERVRWPWTAFEEEDFAGLCAWYLKRHATPAARLRHARRLLEQWRRNQPRWTNGVK